MPPHRLALLILATSSLVVVHGLVNVNVCILCRAAREPQSFHARFAASYYSAEYPDFNVSTQFIGKYESATTARGVIRAYVANASGCAVLVGPGSSSIATAINPLIDEAWIDYSATATELSSRADYPTFNRVVPTDADATSGLGATLVDLKWDAVAAICADSAYGRSVVGGLSGFLRNRTTAGQQRGVLSAACVSPSAGIDVANAELDRVLTLTTRVVLIAVSSSDTFFTNLVNAIVARDLGAKRIFLFSESACSSSTHGWAVVPGAFCATFNVNAAVMGPFMAAYTARDTSADLADFVRLGWPPAVVALKSTGVYPAYAADATRFALRALHMYAAANNGKLPPTAAARAAALRGFTMLAGASGDIAIPTGDRAAADMIVYNSQADGSVVVKARVTGTGEVTFESSLFVLGGQRALADVPPAVDPPPPTDNTQAIVLGVVLGGIVLSIVIVNLVLQCTRSDGRDHALAPKDEDKPFTVMFTDIESSTSQWACNPDVMGAAVDQHHAIIRDVLRRHRGYEVKTIGDSFMVAFHSAKDAVACALEVQERLFAAPWPACIDELYKEKIREAFGEEAVSYADVWSGIRVRIGIHTGLGNVKVDPVTQGYDYYGTVVNTAARVEGVGHGGQILVTKDCYEAAFADPEGGTMFESQTVVSPLGPQPLRGLQDDVPLYQLQGLSFMNRSFPPLRLDVEKDVADENDSGCFDDVDMSKSHLSARTERLSEQGSLRGVASPPKDLPEYVCYKAARKNNIFTMEALIQQFHVAKAIFSALPAKDRARVVWDIAKSWRISEATQKKVPKPGDADADDCQSKVDLMIARLACIAAPVANEYRSPWLSKRENGKLQQQQQVLPGGNTSLQLYAKPMDTSMDEFLHSSEFATARVSPRPPTDSTTTTTGAPSSCHGERSSPLIPGTVIPVGGTRDQAAESRYRVPSPSAGQAYESA